MKHIKQTYRSWILIGMLGIASACNKDKLVEYNTQPDYVLDPPIRSLLPTAITAMHNNDFEAFYDNIRTVSNWAQQFVRKGGNGATFTTQVNNINYRYNTFYLSVAPHLTKIEKMIDEMPEEDKARHVYMRAIPGILKAYYAWYVSDVVGSIPYKEAVAARFNGTFTPVYDTQSALYEQLDQELKNIVATLKTQQPVTQEMFGTSDLYFGNDNTTAIGKWTRVANSLRLKIAMRMTKRDPERVRAIAAEVLADNAGLINSVDEEWVFKAGRSFTAGGNWNPYPDAGFSGEKNVIDFMWNKQDPRLRLYFRKNSWSQANFNTAKEQGKIPAGAVWDARQYYGQYSSPDATSDPAKARFFSSIVITNGTSNVTLDTTSPIQQRLFQSEYESGNGMTTFHLLTYADVCFMRAELAAMGLTNENVSEWYYKGIDASIDSYNKIAAIAMIHDYEAVTADEITAYKNQPDIAFEPAKALEQIAVQQYLHQFKNPNEGWAQIKRTGMPNSNTILALETFMTEGAVLPMPRRFPVNYPLTGDLNYSNKTTAIEEMIKEPGFGLPNDISGRVWWDKQ
ncbi:SusD/RagB family nutrient-binding outer membrane lipoprotein [Chitinophaga cymbidii]|uniref:SusD/RagB family nutrient-binding outer membrane lipoprotein n=1 Tax=Chitinophaga cymbidii TaxID=1096750 RepID=A0A512RDY6_9BACT|nr:SusD/RagB family nutrient-binding outer membrane lipoprotein [Chitinophaga cymbidii]GEP93918.1 hypothetical protein CCY01nite_01780 [Chitinophaga cymbidii]